MAEKQAHLPYGCLDPTAEFVTNGIYNTIVKAVKKYLPAGTSILDFGCGRGEIMKKLAESGYQIWGCDVDLECVRLSRQYGEVTLLGEGNDLSQSFDRKFDCVIASHVLEHLENPKAALSQLASLSKSYLIVSVPNPYYSPNILKALFRRKIHFENERHLNSWDWSHLKTFIECACGLELVEFFNDTVALPLPYRARAWLGRTNALNLLEKRLLGGLFPRFCSSITCVVGVKT